MSKFRFGSVAAIVVSCLCVAGCGGGGGGATPGPSMSLSPAKISVSAKTSDPAPTATVKVTVTSPPQKGVYVGYKSTDNGVEAINFAPVSNTVADLDIQFKSPAQLGPSVYDDTLTVEGCLDEQCTQQIANSPQTVSIHYTVTTGPPTIDQIFPNATVEGGPAFTLTIVGKGFSSASQMQWNGDSRQTHFVSATELTAQISAADISSVGTAAVAILNPAPGGSSDSTTFAINPTTTDAVAFQIDAGHSGDMNFDPVSFPTQSAWSVNVGGQPSYALIADGKVFVTVDKSGSSQLLALDQKTGAVVWGPIVLSDTANAAYDAGSVFVVSSPFGDPAIMQDYDADTGSLEWSTLLSGQYSFSSGPTALNGFVYTGGAGSGGTLYALDETNGAIAWTQPVANGDDSTPAVTADGIYVIYPCQTYDFRPGTGELVWHDADGCDGGGGATPVVANGTLYAPNGFGEYNGDTFNAETGKLLGSYVADNPPAITKTDGYFLQSGTLVDVNLSTNSIIWSFAGDGTLVTSPIVINQYVIVGASSGNLYALNAATGQQVWEVNVGATIPSGAGWGKAMPLSGLSAGHGLLIVPAGDSVIAYRLASD